MHILTKIFIVIVAVLTVALVPLVMVNAANERTFKTRWEEQKTIAAEALHSASQAAAAQAAAQAQFEAINAQLASERQVLRTKLDDQEAASRKLEAEAIGLRARQNDFNAIMKTYAENDKAKTELVRVLNEEIVANRSRLTQLEQEFVKLDEELTSTKQKLEVADAARRALQEDVQRLQEEKDQAMSKVARYTAWVGELPSAGVNATSVVGDSSSRVPADRSLTATIINVRRSPDSVLAEINAGSRDGVQEGWVMTIAEGGKFIGNLRVTNVDVIRSTGVVELEDSQNRGEVRTGQKAVARKGE
ncbi:MAG: hypothetical protein FJ253_10285 [Phycisphaerae bacterium]|nr:hypothetical protein [Phycisphaerae bacterium]